MNLITGLKTSMFILLKTGTDNEFFCLPFWNYLLVKLVHTKFCGRVHQSSHAVMPDVLWIGVRSREFELSSIPPA